MAQIPQFQTPVLQSLCNVLGDTGSGLTGAEIGTLLAQCGIEDVNPRLTKRYRLFEALSRRQSQDHCGNNVAAFVQTAMHPARYVQASETHEDRRSNLNEVLAFAGLQLGDDGRLRHVTSAKTVDEARRRANRLRKILEERRVHVDVLRFCQAELVQDNYFHAVLEATKSIAEKIRQRSGLITDGAELVDQAFGIPKGGYPICAFNSLRTDSERSEHRGLMNLMKGLFGVFRNPTAHAPKISWQMTEEDALDLLTMVSLIHRRLDEMISTGQ